MATDSTLLKRINDLDAHAASQAAQLGGSSNEDWNKFNRNGGGGPASDDWLLSSARWRDLFNRDALNSAYVSAVDSATKNSQLKAQLSKVQAEMLQTFQRGTRMRYSRSRIWACAAAATRLWGFANNNQIHRIATVVDGKSRTIP